MKITYKFEDNEFDYKIPLGNALATLDKVELINVILGTGATLKDIENSMMSLYGHKVKISLEEDALKKYNERGNKYDY